MDEPAHCLCLLTLRRPPASREQGLSHTMAKAHVSGSSYGPLLMQAGKSGRVGSKASAQLLAEVTVAGLLGWLTRVGWRGEP
jgi:hypothetical protein